MLRGFPVDYLDLASQEKQKVPGQKKASKPSWLQHAARKGTQLHSAKESPFDGTKEAPP